MTRRAFFLATLVATFLSQAALADPPSQTAASDLFQLLPPAVRRTVLAQAGDEKLQDVTPTNSVSEALIFDLVMSKGGRNRAMSVAVDGKLIDERVFLEELPVSVRQSIQGLLAGGSVRDITKNVDDTFTETYVVNMARGGTNRQFTVDDEGELQEWQIFLPETPAPVRRCIEDKTQGATLGSITKSFDDSDYEMAYDVEMTKEGKTRGFTVGTNGNLLDEQMFLEETTGPVRKAILAQTKRGRLGEIKKSTADGETNFSVEVSSGRKTVTVTFDTAGAFVQEEEDMRWEDLPPAVKRALKLLQGGAEITDVSRTTESGATSYEIELRQNKKKRYLEFKADGTLVPDAGK